MTIQARANEVNDLLEGYKAIVISKDKRLGIQSEIIKVQDELIKEQNAKLDIVQEQMEKIFSLFNIKEGGN